MKRRGFVGGGLAALAAPACAALPAVLERPALATALAPTAAMLAAARAGSRIVAGGERGIVVFSDDGGRQWQQAQVPVQVSITALAFADERRGWAGGHFGVLLQTADGGRTWSLQLDGVRAGRQALESAADDAQRRAAQRKVDEGPDKPFFDVAVAADGRLLAVGAFGLAFESVDGAAWRSIGHRMPNPRQLHLYAVESAGERVFVAGEQGLLVRSGDRGASFEALPSPYKGSFFGLLAARSGTLLAYGLRGTLFRSTDAGSSWAAVASGVPVAISAGIEQDGTLLLLAGNGDLLVSTDDGRSFQRRPASPPFPAAALAAGDDKTLVLAGLRGLQRRSLA